MKKYILLCIVLALSVGAQGCLAAAVGYGAYTISSSHDEAAQKEAEARNLQTYNSYKTDAEKLNFDREKVHLKPQPVMTFPEWKLAHNIPTPVKD